MNVLEALDVALVTFHTLIPLRAEPVVVACFQLLVLRLEL